MLPSCFFCPITASDSLFSRSQPSGCSLLHRSSSLFSNKISFEVSLLALLFFGQNQLFAVRTGLEPATPGVTGRYSNQLNYRTIVQTFEPMEGIEPTTPRLQITCSGQLSYIGKFGPFFQRGCKGITFILISKYFC